MSTSDSLSQHAGRRDAQFERTVAWLARALVYFVYAVTLTALVIMTLGFILLLLGADPTNGFAAWVYRSLDRVMAPFRGIFRPIDLGTTGNDVQSVLDTSILFAMVVYGLVAFGLQAVIRWLSERIRAVDANERAALAHARQLERDEAYARAWAAQYSSGPATGHADGSLGGPAGRRRADGDPP